MENVLTNGIKKYVKYLPWVCLIGLFCFLSVYMWVCGDRLTDSDISSEMLLARLLNEEHGLISKNWFYSTELRVLNIQIFYSFFFHIFRDWTMVRVATCIVSYLLMLVGYYYLPHQMGYDRIYAVSAIFLLLPVSDGYFEYVFAGSFICILYQHFLLCNWNDISLSESFRRDEKDIAGAHRYSGIHGGHGRRQTCCGLVSADAGGGSFVYADSVDEHGKDRKRLSGMYVSRICFFLCGIFSEFKVLAALPVILIHGQEYLSGYLRRAFIICCLERFELLAILMGIIPGHLWPALSVVYWRLLWRHVFSELYGRN